IVGATRRRTKCAKMGARTGRRCAPVIQRGAAMRAQSASRYLEGVRLPVVALAVAVAVVQLVGSFGAGRGQPERESLDALAILLLLAGPVALVFRARRPVAVLAFVLSVALLYMALGYPYGPVILSPIVAVYTAITSGH